jgi:hypothetical protein
MTTNEEDGLDYGVIDDFLPQKEFREIQKILINEDNIPNTSQQTTLGWLYSSQTISPTISVKDESKNWKYFYMIHSIYDNGIVRSQFYEKIIPVLEELNVKALMRIKANLYPNSEKVHEHEAHIDYPFSHKTAILYINSCNGYTKLKNGTKIDSIANRVLLFDASEPHQSTTTSDQTARFIINFNYF